MSNAVTVPADKLKQMQYEIARMREALERIAAKDFECGNHCRDVARAALNGKGEK